MRYLIIVLALLAVIPMNPQNVSACFCGSPGVTESIMKAKAIFSAKVIQITAAQVKLEIADVWKGNVSGTVLLNHGSSCDPDFKLGKMYLIYARTYRDMVSSQERWFSSACYGSKILTGAERDLIELRSLKLRRNRLFIRYDAGKMDEISETFMGNLNCGRPITHNTGSFRSMDG